jgi:5-methylcytosine-specific restriction endonuclease McrA
LFKQKTAPYKTPLTKEGRVCTSCGAFKVWTAFRGQSKTRLGKGAICKQCVSTTTNKKQTSTRYKKWRTDTKKNNPYRWKATHIRGNLLARVRKFPEMLRENTPTRDEIEKWLIDQEPLVCHYSGEPLSILDITIDHKIPSSRGGSNSFSNLCIASHHMNLAKGSMTEEEFFQLLNLVSNWEDKGKTLLSQLKRSPSWRLK